MKPILWWALCASIAAAAPVTISGPIRKPNLQPAVGEAIISLTQPCLTAGGDLILDRPLPVKFNGTLTVALEPNSVCPNGALYEVRYLVNRVFIGPAEYWVVAPTPTTTTIAAVRRESARPPTFARADTKGDLGVFDGLQWQKLAKGADGQVLTVASATETGLQWSAATGGGGTQQWTSPSLNFGSILDFACGELSFTATGLSVGTPLLVVPYAGIGLVSVAAWASAADTAKIRVCNTSGADVSVSGVFTVKQVASGYLSGSGTLDFPSIIAGGWASLTLTIAGATTGMGAVVVPPATFAGGLQLAARVTATNTLTLTALNLTDADIDPASGSFTGVLIQ